MAPTRPRLLLIAPYFFPRNYGGAVQIYDGLLRRMPGLEITVLSEVGASDPRELAEFDRRHAESSSYRIARLPRLVLHFQTSMLPTRALEMFRFFHDVRRDFERLVADWAPDIVISGATFSTGWLMHHLPASIVRANYIHGEELTMRRGGGLLDRRLIQTQLRALRAADLNIVVSTYSATTLARVAGAPESRTALLPNAIDTRRFTPPTDREALRKRLGWAGHTLLLTIARLIPRKGIDQVLRALADLHRAGRLPADWRYCIGGTGPSGPGLQALAAELGIAARVDFIGFIPNDQLAEYYGAADLFVLTNREIDGDTEGFGIVFIEANACGTPVLGGMAGGTAEAIAENVSGLRVDGDSIADISQALAGLLNNPTQLRRLAEQGLHRARHDFNLDRRAQEAESLILEKLARRKASTTSS
jgi:phosphatidylinositol alpha-1,6-mannosyltransferase